MDSHDPMGQLIAIVSIKYGDGSSQMVGTDQTWQATSSWITYDSVFNGERYDARLEIPGWNEPGPSTCTGLDCRQVVMFLCSSDIICTSIDAWNESQLAVPLGAVLSSQMIPPIRLKQVFRPTRMSEPEKNIFIFDFGQEFSGFCTLRVTGPRGTNVTMRHAEVLSPDGSGMVRPFLLYSAWVSFRATEQTHCCSIYSESILPTTIGLVV